MNQSVYPGPLGFHGAVLAAWRLQTWRTLFQFVLHLPAIAALR
jgi:hypothetical protein